MAPSPPPFVHRLHARRCHRVTRGAGNGAPAAFADPGPALQHYVVGSLGVVRRGRETLSWSPVRCVSDDDGVGEGSLLTRIMPIASTYKAKGLGLYMPPDAGYRR